METTFKKFNDEALMELINEGNHACFQELARRYETYILKHCRKYTKSEDEAEDLCQEIFIKIFTQSKSFKQEAKFKTWLFSVIHNAGIDLLRRSKKNPVAVLGKKLADQIQDIADVAVDMERELSIELMEQLLDSLSPEDRLILMLKYKEKHTIQDIERTLNISQGAVKMRLKRARDKIRTLLPDD
ncbi:MAG: RNA polymerase sigma factor [Cyclobacteriaceae bacterium]